MKKTLRTLSLLIALVLLCSLSAFAAEREDLYALYTNADTFMPLRIKSENIRKNGEKITFQSMDKNDTSTYVLDENTVYEDTAENAEKGLAAFLQGEKTEITVYIPKCQYYLFRQKENAEVSISAVPSFEKVLPISLPSPENPFAVLEAFSIIEENADKNAPVTRSQMADMLVSMCRLTDADVAVSPEKAFSDVPTDAPSHHSIHIARELGILHGYGDGTFRPDAAITGRECVKTVVALLGYTPLAEARGGYPNGYMQIAAQIGLTKDIVLDALKPVTLSVAASLLKNALYLPDMVQTVYKSDAAEYDVMDGTNGKPYIRFYDRYFRD